MGGNARTAIFEGALGRQGYDLKCCYRLFKRHYVCFGIYYEINVQGNWNSLHSYGILNTSEAVPGQFNHRIDT